MFHPLFPQPEDTGRSPNSFCGYNVPLHANPSNYGSAAVTSETLILDILLCLVFKIPQGTNAGQQALKGAAFNWNQAGNFPLRGTNTRNNSKAWKHGSYNAGVEG